MEAMDGTQPAEISRVAIRLPPFWAERPAVWFAQAEAQFSLTGISSERKKFHYVISAGPTIRRRSGHHHLSSSAGSILQAEDRAAETTRSPDSHARRDGRSQAIAVPEAPQNLVPDLPDYFLRTSWLPAKVQAALACHPEVELDAVANFADRIIENIPPSAFASICQPADNNELLRRIEELSRRMTDLSPERDRPLSRDCPSSSRDRPSSH
jgi:hypothetical protein